MEIKECKSFDLIKNSFTKAMVNIIEDITRNSNVRKI